MKRRSEERLLEEENAAICNAMLRNDGFTKCWRKNGKFHVESDNVIYRKARSATELLNMISRVMAMKP